ncbi:hypothetical protein Dsin_011808 [Dipteronia sinensis]|uniref:Leucine-rich repeat-containing N-terminal plant-type domain-containing protein n=1 Tax=Dipteronia sinensis TaxID=43782 RepID=A0AAE0E7C4_9ROSI|nr:hypothetical protein Dsin_011808 [Dipteronia sinensis]
MIFNSSVFVISVQTLFLACIFSFSNANDIYCLKAIKDSLEDPLNHLSTWTFHNLTTDSSICRFQGVTCWNDKEARILSIQLRNMGLKGEFPQGVENCNSLQCLDLSGNNLFGSIPSDPFQKSLNYLVYLSLSNNSLSGEIPSTIANCTFLNKLLLDHNQLTGHIPMEFLKMKRIKEFSVSSNMLSGPVPTFPFVNFTIKSYENNNGLCGGPLERCEWPRPKFDHSFKSGFLIGYLISTVSFVTVFLSYCVPWVRVEKGKKITIATMIMLIWRKNKRDR